MDDLDRRILREFGTDKILLWGAMDPRVSASDLARRLSVDKSTVLSRLHAWESAGFLQGFHAIPSVQLFGMSLRAAGVRVDDVAQKARVLDALAKVDGMLTAMEHVGEWIGLAFADDGQGSGDATMAALAAVPGVAETQPPMVHHVPACTIQPTALGWRILQALRAEGPRAPLATLADRVGVSPNTFRARYEQLIDAHAVWSIPALDFTRYTGAILSRFVLEFDRSIPRARMLEATRKAIPAAMEHPSPEIPDAGPALLSIHVQAASIGDLEELTLAARAIPGVTDVEVLHPRRFRVYGAWIDDRIEGALALAKGSSP